MTPGEGARPRRADLAWTLAIWLPGLAIRLACALQFAGHPLGRSAWIDEQAYWGRALAILGGQWLPDRPFYQDPLLPYLLAVVAAVVGPDLAHVRVALAGLGSLTPPAAYWAGRLGLGRAEGVLAGLILAFHGPLAFTDATLEKEGIGALVAAIALALTARAAGRPDRPSRAAASGAAWGLLALLRANALLVAPLGVAWWLLAFRGGSGSGSGRPRAAALAFAAGFATALAPSTAINARVSDPPEFILTTWQAGANFYIGNHPGATGTYAEVPFAVSHPFFEAVGFAAEANRRAGRRLSAGDVSRFWLREGLAFWRAEPLAASRLLARKAALVVNDHEVADNHNYAFVRLVAVPALTPAVVRFGWLLPIAALGLGVGRPGRSPFWWFLVLSTALGLASTALFFVLGRYRLPWVPGLALLAGAGLVDAARRLAPGRRRGLALRLGLLAAPAAAIAWAPSSVPIEDRWGLALRRVYRIELAAGRVDPAIDALDDARALGPVPADALHRMLAAGPDHDAIKAHLATVRGTGPGATLRRARILRQLPEGRAEARRLLDDRLGARPDDPATLRESGAWWLGAPDDPDARRRAAADLAAAAPDDPSAAVLLGLLSRDPRPLDPPPPGADPTRLRVARAILADARRAFLKSKNPY